MTKSRRNYRDVGDHVEEEEKYTLSKQIDTYAKVQGRNPTMILAEHPDEAHERGRAGDRADAGQDDAADRAHLPQLVSAGGTRPRAERAGAFVCPFAAKAAP